MKVLLDTHILIYWLGTDLRLSAEQKRVLEQASPESPLWVSDITLWEIATLYNLKRLSFHLPLRDWLEAADRPTLSTTGWHLPCHCCGSGCPAVFLSS